MTVALFEKLEQSVNKLDFARYSNLGVRLARCLDDANVTTLIEIYRGQVKLEYFNSEVLRTLECELKRLNLPPLENAEIVVREFEARVISAN